MPALEGIRVLELGQIYNGPYCGLLLAHMGADVVKVEPPGGEQLRYRSTDQIDTHEFLMLNSNKRSVVINLKEPDGVGVLRAMVKHVDVLIENFAPGTMDRLGLRVEDLMRINPRLIFASGKGYGSTGPYAHMSAMDITVQAMSGAIASTGHPGEPPLKAGPAFIDFSGGIHLYAAIMTALIQRERTGLGQAVEVSMHDTVYPMLASALGGLHNDPTRNLPERTGNRHSGLAVAPYNVYEASDGHIAIISISEKHFAGVVKAAGLQRLADDARFSTRRARAQNMSELDAAINEWSRTRTRADSIDALQLNGVPCAPVRTVREVDTDPHLIERGMIRYVEHEGRGTVPVPGSPLRLSGSPVEHIRVAPKLGSSTDEVLREVLDLTDEQLADLANRGVTR